MVKDHKYGQMELAMMVDGMKIKFKGMENLYMQTKMNTKENFMLIEQMDLEDMYKNVVKRMKVSGLTTNHMERVN